ncbi:MAG: glycosyltransferase family 4 protein [Candidatus Heimdallarchaeota archaeon]
MVGKNRIQNKIVYIVLACSYFIDPRVKQEVKTLNNNGFFTYVLSWDREGKHSDLSKENLFVKSVKLLQARKFSKFVFLMSAILFQISIFIHGVKLLKKHKNIILHANDFNTILGLILLKFFFPKRIKTVYDCHELTPAVYSEWYGDLLGTIIAKLEKMSLRFVDAIITVSPPIQKYLETISNKKVHLIWNYPSETLFPKLTKQQARKQLGIKGDKFVIVYVGSLRLDIALLELVSAIKYLSKNKDSKIDLAKLEVIIVGDGTLLNELQTEVDENHLNEVIRFTGRVEREKSLTYLIASDLSYILFTVKGLNTKIGMPWKLFESLVAGTPVLVIANTYAASFTEKRNLGYSIEKSDKDNLIAKLEKIINSSEKLKINLRNQLLWENQEKKLIKIYSEIFSPL